jgi:GTPase SAR1 family protein
MDRYQQLKNELIRINQDVSSLVLKATSMPGISADLFSEWEKIFDAFGEDVSRDIVRVAVVGPIKSGKSTFINSILGHDYLKRGAGVITSIVTKIRSGPLLRANLFFKSWREVNSDMAQALVLLPFSDWQSKDRIFDIRSKQDRIELHQAMSSLNSSEMIIRDSRNANSVLLMSYLKGYDKIKEIVTSENIVKEYGSKQFSKHKEFVGNDSLAVYLKDVRLEIDNNEMDDIVELADCQGSDSSNPLHLAMIQDYLLLTHYLIYVISSRTGLRQADIKFLSMIKKMGIIENILFVINGDISEHESINDLKSLVGRVLEELSLIVPEPDIFTFSSLFNLFKANEDTLATKDQQRLDQWKGQKKLVTFSNKESRRFVSLFFRKLTREKYTLLLKNHLERLGVIIEGVLNWSHVNQGILSREEGNLKEFLEKVRMHQEKMSQVKRVVKNTLDGSIPKAKSELKKEIDRFFDLKSGFVLSKISDFVRTYTVPSSRYEDVIKHSGFTNTLYLIYQDFKIALDGFIAEKINPEIIHFIGKTEKKIQVYFEEVANPYVLIAQDAIQEYKDSMAAFEIALSHSRPESVPLIDMNLIKGIAGIKFTPVNASMRYSVRVKSEAIMRLGFYSALKILRRILKKPFPNNKQEEILALDDGVRRIKRETEKSIIVHFRDYKENIKFQYFFKLIESIVNNSYDILRKRIEIYSSDLSLILDSAHTKNTDKAKAAGTIRSIEASANIIIDRIEDLRKKIDLF